MFKNFLVTSLVCFSVSGQILEAACGSNVCGSGGSERSCCKSVDSSSGSNVVYDAVADFSGYSCLSIRGNDDYITDLEFKTGPSFTSYNLGSGTGAPTGSISVNAQNDPCINGSSELVGCYHIRGNSSQKTFSVSSIGIINGECTNLGSMGITRIGSYGVLDIQGPGNFYTASGKNGGWVYIGHDSEPGNVIVRNSSTFCSAPVKARLSGSSLTGAADVTFSNAYTFETVSNASVAVNASSGTTIAFSGSFTANTSGGVLGINYTTTPNATDSLTNLTLNGTVEFKTTVPSINTMKVFAGTLKLSVVPDKLTSILLSGAGSPSLSLNNVTLGTGTTIDFQASTNPKIVVDSGTSTIQGILTNGGFSKTGAGKLVLTNTSSSYTSTTTMTAGTLSIASANSLGSGSLVGNGGTLETTANVNFSRSFSLNSGKTTYLQPSTGTTLTLQGVVSGGGSVVMNGAGTTTFSSPSNTYSGTTTLTSGTISIASAACLGSGSLIGNGGILQTTGYCGFSSSRSVALNSGTTTQFKPSTGTTVSLAGAITGSGNFHVSGGGIVEVIKNSGTTFTGPVRIYSGTLAVSGTNPVGSSGYITAYGGALQSTGNSVLNNPISLVENLTVIPNNGTTLELTNHVGDGLWLIVNGPGTLNLSHDSNSLAGIQFTNGTVTVAKIGALGGGNFVGDGGRLQTTGSMSLNSSRTITLYSGKTLTLSPVTGITLTVDSLISDAGSLIIDALGSVVLNNTGNTYSGGTVLTSGTATMSKAAFGTGAITSNGGTISCNATVTFPNAVVLNAGKVLTIKTNAGVITTFSGIIADPSGVTSNYGKIVIDGSGDVDLIASNTFQGDVEVVSGTLGITSGQSLGGGTNIAKALLFKGGVLKALASLNSGVSITLQQAANLETVSGASLTLSGVITGAAGINYDGNGTIILTSGSSNFTGPINVTQAGTLEITSAGALGVTSAVNMAADSTFRVSADGLTVSRNISLTGAASGSVDFDVGQIGSTNITTTYSATISGGGSLSKIGSGTLVMTGSPSYTGGSYLTGGTFSIGSAANLPTGGIVYFNGGVLAARNTLSTPVNMDLNLADANFSIPSGQVLTASGILSGANGIVFSGGGTLELSGSNTFQGKTTISTGILKVSSAANLGGAGSIILSGGTLLINGSFTTEKGFETLNGTVQVDGSYNATFTGVMDSKTGSTLTKTGTGKLVLNPLSQASIPNVTISQGSLSASTNILASSKISIASGTNLTFSQTSDGTFTGSISGDGPLIVDASSSSAVLSMGTTSSNTYKGGTTLKKGILAISRNSDLGQDLTVITASGGTLRANDTCTISRNTTLTSGTKSVFSALANKTLKVEGLISSSGALEIGEEAATGTVYLNPLGANSNEGGITLSYGTLEINQDDSLGSNANVLTCNGGSLFVSSDMAAPQPMSLVANKNTGIKVDTGKNLTWNGLISGSGSFTKTGLGILTLGASNGYTGALSLVEGSIAISAPSNLSGSLVFQGGTLSLTESMTLAIPMTFDSTDGLFSVASTKTATFSNVLSGDFGLELVKENTGTLVLSGANTYFGTTQIFGGTLEVSNNGNLGKGDNIVIDGGTLKIVGASFSSPKNLSTLNGSIQVSSGILATFTGSVDSSALSALTKTGSGDLFLDSPSQDYIRKVTVSEGGLKGSTNSLQGSTIAVSAGARLTFSQSNNGDFTGTISGDGSVIIDAIDSGAILTMKTISSNTYRGGTTVKNGILAISSNNDLGYSTSSITGSGGTLRANSGVQLSRAITLSSLTSSTFSALANKVLELDGLISGSGNLVIGEESATGTVYLNPLGANANIGGITLSYGTLQINQDDSLGDFANILTGDGGSLLVEATIPVAQAMVLNNLKTTTVNVGKNAILTWNGVISGLGALEKVGNGTMALGGINTFEGGLTIREGIVSVSIPENLPCGFPVTFSGGSLTVLSSMILNEPLFLNATAPISTATGLDVSLSGTITGDFALSLSGGGSFLLSGVNTAYYGNTTVASSTLQFSTDQNLGSGSMISLDTSILEVVASASTIDSSKGFQKLIATTIDVSDNIVTFTGALSSLDRNSSITKLGDGTLKLLPLTGESLKTLVLSEGSFVGNSFSLASTTITTSSLTEIAFYQEQNGTFSGSISGAGSFRMTGTPGSVLSVTNSQSYTGGLTLQSGMYSVSKDNQLGSSGVEIFAVGFDGALQATDTFSTSRYLTFIDAGVTVDVQNNGSRKNTLTFTSSVIGDTLTKTGPGTLALDGTTTVTSYVVVDEGTLYVGGVMQGSTPPESSSFSSSSFESFSAPASLSVEVGSAGILLGEGEINADVVVSGIIAGGDGFNESTLTINGNVSMESGSTLGVRINPLICSNLLVEGDFMIDSFSRALILPSPGVYPKPQVLNLLDVGGTISGQFNSADVPEVLFMTATLDYSNPSSISVTVTPLQIFPEVTGRNADAVATSLDNVIDWNRLNVSFTLPLVDTVSNALLPGVLRSLMPLASYPNKMTNTLNKMQPAALKGLVIAQESASIEVRGALSSRMQNALDTKSCYALEDGSCKDDTKRVHIWLSGMGNVLNQKSNTYNHSPQVGYQSKLVGTVAGVDAHFLDYFYAGALGGYTNSHINWKENRGHGDVNTGYGGLYLSFLGEMFYGNASIIGGWSSYNTTRNIFYPGVHETAKGQRQGRELLSHIDTGINLGFSGFTVRPFDSFDYLAGVENSYEETGARDWNLRIRKSNAIMLRNELGLQFAGCVCVKESKWTVSPKVSWVREVRVKGSHYRASFAGASEFPFTVTGYFPSRNLFSPGLMIAGTMYQDRLGINFTYDGEFTGGYSAQKYTAEARFGF